MDSMLSAHNHNLPEQTAVLSSLVQISQITTMIKEQTSLLKHESVDSFQKMSTTMKETTTKKSKKRPNTQNEGKPRKRNKEHHQKDDTEVTAPPKRLQVPRACSNCRRMHAGCGVERPCKRCIHNGLEATCIDVPRKKRSMKKGKNDSEDGDMLPVISGFHSSPEIEHVPVVHIKSEGDQHHHQMWEDTFQELYGSSGTSSAASSMTSFSDIDLSAPLIFGSESSDNSGFFSSFSHNEPVHHEKIHQHDLFEDDILPQEPHHDLPLPLAVHHHEDPEFHDLLQEITHLNQDNKTLESKIHSLCEELLELKKTAPPKKRSDPGTMTQQSIMESPDVAVSMWVASFTDLVLVECDSKFVQIMGLPMDILKDNFPFSKVLENTPSDHNWPKKVKITTLSGPKDVLMTINMLTDGATAKYFVVHILEL